MAIITINQSTQQVQDVLVSSGAIADQEIAPGFHGFAKAYTFLENLLLNIKHTTPAASPASYKAYTTGWNAAKQNITDVVGTLTDDQVTFVWTGLYLTDSSPPDRKRDIVNSLLSTWDKAAGGYAKGDAKADDANNALLPRLAQFDRAINTENNVPVGADQP